MSRLRLSLTKKLTNKQKASIFAELTEEQVTQRILTGIIQ